jgi:serine O-acetyltransferase
MFDSVTRDFIRYLPKCESLGFLRAFKIFLSSFGFHAMLVYRMGKWSEKQIVPLRYPLLAIHWVLARCMAALYGIHIKRSARIAPGLYIGHCGGICVGDCVIGPNSNISPRVVIDGDNRGAAIIGKSVWIGAHVTIIGPIHIGDGATIGAGVTVVSDIPTRCLIMGNPARVVSADYDNSSFCL